MGNALMMTIELAGEKRIQQAEEIITDLVKNLVNKPDAVTVSRQLVGQLVAVAITPHQEDVRLVVGSKGKHFKALEALLAELIDEWERAETTASSAKR